MKLIYKCLDNVTKLKDDELELTTTWFFCGTGAALFEEQVKTTVSTADDDATIESKLQAAALAQANAPIDKVRLALTMTESDVKMGLAAK